MTKFETEICSRCHGTGEYSYCAEYGTRCFKCGGAKRVLTARGKAAAEYFAKLCSKPISDIKPGDRIKAYGFTNNGRQYAYKTTVIEVGEGNECTYITNGVKQVYKPIKLTFPNIDGEKASMSGPSSTLIRVYSGQDAEYLEQALVYQNELTKTGTPRKHRRKV